MGTLGFLGDLQAADGQRSSAGGIDRRVGAGEIVLFTPLYGAATGNRPGGTEAVLADVNGPVRANKLMAGRVVSVTTNNAGPAAIPAGGAVLSGGPGAGADWLAQHLRVGDRVSFVLAVAPPAETGNAVQIAELPRTRADLPSRAGEALSRPAWLWGRVEEAVGGGPRLLTHGQVTTDGVAEGFDPWIIGGTHPRTAVGTSRDGRHLVIVTVDGRQAISKGVTLADLALILKRYGAWDAINLDGGGSTAMAVAGLVVNSPSGSGAERRVAETLLVYSDRVASAGRPAPARMRLAIPGDGPVPVWSATPVHVLDGDREISGGSPDVLWQGPATGGIGFVNQRGYFIAVKPGTGAIMALYKGHLIAAQISVTSPAPVLSTLRAECGVRGGRGRGQPAQLAHGADIGRERAAAGGRVGPRRRDGRGGGPGGRENQRGWVCCGGHHLGRGGGRLGAGDVGVADAGGGDAARPLAPNDGGTREENDNDGKHADHAQRSAARWAGADLHHPGQRADAGHRLHGTRAPARGDRLVHRPLHR